jgi:lipoprotein-releasing system ATP-binding protein
LERNDDIVLRAEHLSRRFTGTDSDIVVLEDVSLSVRRGEVVGIVGASGVGKSTLLHILGSLDDPDAGTVTVGGADVHAIRGRELDQMRSNVMGFVFQFHFLLPDFTALENVMLPRLVRDEGEREAAHAATAWLDKVGLADRLTHKPGELSGGEQQRVAVARALVNDPEVVFADEPTGNLDDETGDEIHALIRALADRENKSFVVVTHKREFARFSDRVLVLADRGLRPLE